MQRTRYFGLVVLALLHIPNTLAEIIVDGSLGGAAKTLSGPNYTINQSLGQTQGNNLFHSFSQFNINTGESANFLANSNINNIFARVTGGNSSLIDGGLTTNSNANFWLINPAGWVIGKNAAINLPGSFHLSTATSLDFKDGGSFQSDPSAKSTLSIAEPIDFQFQNSKAATITLDQAAITLKEGKDLSLLGSDIHLQDAHITVPGGRILLGSNAGAQGKWQIDEQGLTQSSGQQGTINIDHDSSKTASLTNPSLSINAPPQATTITPSGGKIQLAAQQIKLTNALLSANSRNNVKQASGEIELHGDSIQLAHSTLSATVNGDQTGSNIKIVGKDLTLTGVTDSPSNGSIIKTDASLGSTGNAGAISIDLSGKLTLDAQSNIDSRTLGTGTGGTISVNSPHVNLDEQSFISVETFGKGNAGSIVLNSRDLNLKLASFIQSSAGTGSQGNAGNIAINSSNIALDQSFILAAAGTSAKGETGNISINQQITPQVQNSDQHTLVLHRSIIGTSNLSPQGNGGIINVSTGTLVMNTGFIQANAAAAKGKGGTVTVNADRTLLTQEQLAVGGNVRYPFNNQSTLNVIQAAAPLGESGEVHVSPVELNIAGQLAKVDASFLNNRPIANDPCSVGRGEETSSLVQSGNGGLAPNAGDPVSLPLYRHSKLTSSAQHADVDNPENAVTLVQTSSNPVCDKDKR